MGKDHLYLCTVVLDVVCSVLVDFPTATIDLIYKIHDLGRTGTLIGIDQLITAARLRDPIDVIKAGACLKKHYSVLCLLIQYFGDSIG